METKSDLIDLVSLKIFAKFMGLKDWLTKTVFL